MIVSAYFNYIPESCPKCGCINENNNIRFRKRKNKKVFKNIKKEMSQYDIVTYLINTDNKLKGLYNILSHVSKNLNSKLKITLKTNEGNEKIYQ